jgi:hypothetical protein
VTMTVSERVLLALPTEITVSNDSFSVDVAPAGSPVAATIDIGTYANVFTVIYAVRAKLQSIDANFDIVLDTNLKCYLTHATTAFSITWTDAALGTLLGFSGNLTGNTLAPNIPERLWLSTYGTNDRSPWTSDESSIFSGVRALNGRLSGTQTGPVLYSKSFSFEAESGGNVFEELGTTAVQQARCLEYIIRSAKSGHPTTAGNAACNGVYVFPDADTAISMVNNGTSSFPAFDSGGVSLSMSSSPEVYVYCHFEVKTKPKIKPTLSVGRQYWDIDDLELYTATAPTWDEP